MAKSTKAEKKTEVKEVTPVHERIEKTEEEITIARKLGALYALQQIDSKIDKIRIVRGELPLEVQDLEDEIEGLDTRINNFQEEIKELKTQITEKQSLIKNSQVLIKKYETQMNNVRNSREYDSLNKELVYQNLEIQVAEKRIKEFNTKIELVNDEIQKAKERLKERKGDLDQKQSELHEISSETEKEEKELARKSEIHQKLIEERLVSAYKRIRLNARNHLAVVQIERDACGGCFNKIPPQHQLDIRMHKKIIVCEYCGRILVDNDIVDAIANQI